jgi:hypothetical protein
MAFLRSVQLVQQENDSGELPNGLSPERDERICQPTDYSWPFFYLLRIRLNKLFLLDHSNIQTRPTVSTAVLVVVDAFCPDRAFAKVEDLMPFGWNFSSDRSCFAPVFIAEPCWPIIHQPVRSSVNAAWSLSSLLPSQAPGLLRLELRTAVPSV